MLSSVQETLERNPGSDFGRFFPEQLTNLRQLLRDLHIRTTQREIRGYRRLRWPFRQEENAEIVSKIERFKANLSIGLNLNQTYFSHLLGQRLQTWLAEIIDAVERLKLTAADLNEHNLGNPRL